MRDYVNTYTYTSRTLYAEIVCIALTIFMKISICCKQQNLRLSGNLFYGRPHGLLFSIILKSARRHCLPSLSLVPHSAGWTVYITIKYVHKIPEFFKYHVN